MISARSSIRVNRFCTDRRVRPPTRGGGPGASFADLASTFGRFLGRLRRRRFRSSATDAGRTTEKVGMGLNLQADFGEPPGRAVAAAERGSVNAQQAIVVRVTQRQPATGPVRATNRDLRSDRRRRIPARPCRTSNPTRSNRAGSRSAGGTVVANGCKIRTTTAD